jgi:hypothetical protein
VLTAVAGMFAPCSLPRYVVNSVGISPASQLAYKPDKFVPSHGLASENILTSGETSRR